MVRHIDPLSGQTQQPDTANTGFQRTQAINHPSPLTPLPPAHPPLCILLPFPHSPLALAFSIPASPPFVGATRTFRGDVSGSVFMMFAYMIFVTLALSSLENCRGETKEIKKRTNQKGVSKATALSGWKRESEGVRDHTFDGLISSYGHYRMTNYSEEGGLTRGPTQTCLPGFSDERNGTNPA